MLETIIVIALIIALGMIAISIKVVMGKPFPNFHIEGNKALKDVGITCVHNMESDERKPNPYKVKE